MYINPQTAIDNGWITGIEDPDKQIQPNAIDFPLDVVYEIDDYNLFIISETTKVMRGGGKLNPSTTVSSAEEFWTLEANSCYDGMSNICVDLPEGVACELIIRSTFNRNGIFLTSGLYDSGYKGPIGFAIHNRSGRAQIGVGTRFGQIKFVASDKAGMYAGGYNHDAGSHWSEKGNDS